MYGSHGRTLLLRTSALGALRRDLVKSLGSERAQGFLLRYGWSQGQDDAATVRRELPQLSDADWLEEGPRRHTEARMGTVHTETLIIDRVKKEFRVEGTWEDSYEASEHLRHFGLAKEPVCWTMAGYASGYSTEVFGERVIVKEVACQAKGDPFCRFVGLPERVWGVRVARESQLYEQYTLVEELEEAHQRIRLQNDQLLHIVTLHDELSQMLLHGLGLPAVVSTVSRLLGTTVTVEDRRLGTLAAFSGSNRPGVGEVPPVTLADLVQKDPTLKSRLSALGREKRAVVIGAANEPNAGMVVAPIMTGEELLGYVTMSMVDGLTPDLTRMVVERTAIACALELLKERTAMEVEHRLRGDFLENLIAQDGDADFLNKWARHLGLELTEGNYRFYVVQSDTGNDNEQMLAVQGRLQQLATEALATQGLTVFAVPRGGFLVILLPDGPDAPAEIARRILDRAEQGRTAVWIGISRPFLGAGLAAQAYEECRSLLTAMRAGGAEGPVVQVDRLGAMRLLSACVPKDEAIRFCEDLLAPLVRYDKEHQSDLMATLHQYLRHEGNLLQTSRKLNISISGLKYRLQRIQEVGKVDLDDPEQRFDLIVASRLFLVRNRLVP